MLDELKALAALGLLGIAASKASKKKQDETRREQYAATHKRIAFICPGCGTRYIRTADLNAEIYQHCCPKCKRWWTIHKFSWQEL